VGSGLLVHPFNLEGLLPGERRDDGRVTLEVHPPPDDIHPMLCIDEDMKPIQPVGIEAVL